MSKLSKLAGLFSEGNETKSNIFVKNGSSNDKPIYDRNGLLVSGNLLGTSTAGILKEKYKYDYTPDQAPKMRPTSEWKNIRVEDVVKDALLTDRVPQAIQHIRLRMPAAFNAVNEVVSICFKSIRSFTIYHDF